jgi:hypothetical protein
MTAFAYSSVYPLCYVERSVERREAVKENGSEGIRRKGEISCFAVFPLVFTAEDYTGARDRGAGGDLLLMDYWHAYLPSLNKYNTKNT